MLIKLKWLGFDILKSKTDFSNKALMPKWVYNHPPGNLSTCLFFNSLLSDEKTKILFHIVVLRLHVKLDTVTNTFCRFAIAWVRNLLKSIKIIYALGLLCPCRFIMHETENVWLLNNKDIKELCYSQINKIRLGRFMYWMA